MKAKIITILIIILLSALFFRCSEKRVNDNEHSTTPMEGPDKEYPGSKQNDSIYNEKENKPQ